MKHEPVALGRAFASAALLHGVLLATLILGPRRHALVVSQAECEAIAKAKVGDVIAIVLETEGEPAGSHATPRLQEDRDGAHETSTSTSTSTGKATSASTSTGSSTGGSGSSGATSTSTRDSMGTSTAASTPPATEAVLESPVAPAANVWGAPPLAAPPAGVPGTSGSFNPFLARGALPELPRRPIADVAMRRAGPQGPTAAEARHKIQALLRAPARERERELGLGPEGPVLHALGDATSASHAPVRGRAVFLAIADAKGMIVGIDVVECNGERPLWAVAAGLARVALMSTKLRLPSTARRAEMRIEVVSEWKLPSLHDPGVDSSVLGFGVGQGEGEKSTRVAVLDVLPTVRMTEVAKGVKLPVPRINGDAMAADGDLADLGAKPRRIVRTKLLDSLVL